MKLIVQRVSYIENISLKLPCIKVYSSLFLKEKENFKPAFRLGILFHTVRVGNPICKYLVVLYP